jgi:hypothetical protein
MPASVGNPINIPRKAIPFVYGEVGANPSVTTGGRIRSKPGSKAVYERHKYRHVYQRIQATIRLVAQAVNRKIFVCGT